MVIKPFKFKYKIQDGETCFSYLGKFVDEMDAAADDFLSQFEFMPSDEIADKIWTLAFECFKNHDEDWEKTPEWAANIIDCGVPYCNDSKDGSLWYALGLSLSSRDAHLRCFYENVKNGTNHELPFPVVVPKNIEQINLPKTI